MDHVDHLEGGYATQVRLGLERACAERDVELLIFVGREFGVLPHSRIYELLDPDCVDGAVLLSSGLSARLGLPALIDFAERCPALPLCSLGIELPGVPSVIADNRPGLAELFDHLIVDHGKRRLAFLAGHEHNPDARTRLAVYREALERHGLGFDESLLVREAFDPSTGARATRELLERGVVFDAIVAGNDAGALGALETLRERGLRVPRDVALTGFDDLTLCRFTKPPLTTVRQPIARMAAVAVGMVCDQIEGKPAVACVRLPVELVRRASCGCRQDVAVPAPVAVQQPAAPLPWFRAERQHLEQLLHARLRAGSDHDFVPGLLDALEDELSGRVGALGALLEDLVTHGAERDRTYDELELALALLRDASQGVSGGLEQLWSAAQRALGSANTADQVRQRIELESSYTQLLRSAERLSTALDLTALKEALRAELPGLLKSAFISLSEPTQPGELLFLFGMCDGAPCESDQPLFKSSQLLPDDVTPGERRRTWMVLPLTFEQESLGVALLEMQPSIAIHDILRTQISSALKGAALHREIVRKTAQHERSVQERLATAKRMNALSVLAGGVAHDLNNALGPLLALPDVMLGELHAQGAGGAELSNDILTIRSAAVRAAQTIKDLLALGRQGRTQREPLDLNALASSCFVAESSLRERAAQSGVRVTLELNADPLVIRASEAQLGRAISNLLRNAIEAIDGAGAVSLTTRFVRLDEPLTAYETIDPGEYAVLSVSDSGQGIAVADLGRIFEPFFTRKKVSDSSGSGLGLAIVHGAVKEHDGFTDVVSERGLGTRFSLYLPLVAATLADQRAPSSVPRGSAQLLVIDDDPLQLRTAMRVLTRLGYRVVTASSAGQGYELYRAGWARQQRSLYDLVLVDMLLDEASDGLELFERLCALEPTQRGIVVSGHAPTVRAELAVARGLPFLAKPYSADELGRAVRSALSGRDSKAPDAGPPTNPRSHLKLLK
ncbi:MAG: substrate-binding domain-containing protein [Polyangiaceae bacterium]